MSDEIKKEEPNWIAPVREIIIKTDGTNILVEKNETSGTLEMMAVLSKIIQRINK